MHVSTLSPLNSAEDSIELPKPLVTPESKRKKIGLTKDQKARTGKLQCVAFFMCFRGQGHSLKHRLLWHHRTRRACSRHRLVADREV
jgi:hypothetical protein